MKKLLLITLLMSLTSGCAILQSTGVTETKPTVTGTMMKKEFDAIPPPAAGKPLSVAVYSFQDKTGQRRPQANVASLSTAVTQGAETFLIKALQDVGRGQWFEVVERVGIDNLTKERLIIRQMREAYEGANAKPLMPMQFAGMIVEGGIIGYDTSVNSGGAGHRFLGIGKQTQWTQDTVTVSLRAISVNTGKVLISVTVQKTILSSADSISALKFFDMGTKAFEAEAGLTINEPGTYAVKAAVEMGVVELIKEGKAKGIWDYKQDAPMIPTQPVEQPRIEEKKDDVKPISTTVPPKDNGAESSAADHKKPEAKTEVKQSAVMYLKYGLYVNKTHDEKSTRVWFFGPGLEVEVIEHHKDWVKIKARDGKQGFVKKDVLTSDKP